ncbi:Fibroblast growth factor receptor substrate 2 [Trichuris trichiura]|uniref:Fibroblast growth factor receptor substrate 2 n=1 Tax=Trichuris trichiura TaxID=36087 RepID=A0A077YVQ3_TRITR|nr:Fibroblast growth factor receptor substrate 2 [Trichuris trichiura]
MLNGVLKICPAGIFLYDRKRVVVHWPLQYVRRYGYGEDVFSNAAFFLLKFESGRRSESGPGVYTFQCSRAGELFYVVHGTILETGTSSGESARISSANADGSAFKHGLSAGGRLYFFFVAADSNDEAVLSCRGADSKQASYFQFLCQRVPSRTKSLGSESSPSVPALPPFDQTNTESSTSTTLSSSDSTTRASHHRSENTEASAKGSHYAVIDYMKTKALHDTTALQGRSAEECGAFLINDTYMRS